MVATRSTPARDSAASNTSPLSTMFEEWVTPITSSSYRPDFTTTTGLVRAAARSALMKRRESCTWCTCNRMPWVKLSAIR
ncbi:hypothetical protein D3C85_1040370 [compost metagenome]